MADPKTLEDVLNNSSQDPENRDNPFGRGNLYDPKDVANIQVLVAKEGDRIPRMLSARRPIFDQLQDLAREFGEKHVTINGEPYSVLAEEHGLERRGDDSLPFAAGAVGAVQQYDPDQKIAADRDAGVHNADNRVGEILPTAEADPNGALAAEARRRKEEQKTLDEALENDEKRKELLRRESDEIASQQSRQQAESAGEGMSPSGPDGRMNAQRQEEKSDAQLAAVADSADAGKAARADAMAAQTNEDRQNLIAQAKRQPEPQAASRDVNQLSPDPQPVLKGSSRHDAVNGTVKVGSTDVKLAEIVGKAQQRSGRSPEEWNELSDDERAQLIDDEIADRRISASA